MLDPQALAYLKAHVDPQAGAPRSVAEARAAALAESVLGGAPDPVMEVWDDEVAGPDGRIPIRVYRDRAESSVALMWLHGGGWVTGDLTSADRVCRALAARAGLTVVSVGYRLAPEDPYPAALRDARATFEWLWERSERLGIERGALGVGGDSAGGNLAAAVALRQRHERARPAYSLLVYPILEVRAETHSRTAYATGHGYPLAELEWSWAHYLPAGPAAADQYAAPAQATSLAGLPPTLLYAAECDILFSEGEQFVRRMRAAGLRAHLITCEGQIHGFIGLAGEIDAALTFFSDVGRRVPQLLGGELTDDGELGAVPGAAAR